MVDLQGDFWVITVKARGWVFTVMLRESMALQMALARATLAIQHDL